METQKPFNLKAYWESNHGKQMKGVFLVVALVAGVGIFKALPLIIAGFANLVVATSLAAASVVALAGLGALGYFLTRPKLWQAVTIRLNNAAAQQRRKAIADDPIGTGEQALASMRGNHERTKHLAQKVWAAVKTGEKRLQQWRNEREQRMALYQEARKLGDEQEAAVNARAAEVRGQSIDKNALGVANAKQMAQLLDRVTKNIGMKLVIFTDELNVLKQELELKGIVNEAGKEARKTMQGPEYDLLMESMEATITQISQYEAGIDQFVADVMPSIKEEDLKNGVLTADALRNAESWLKSQDKLPDNVSVIESDEARHLLSAGSAKPIMRGTARLVNAPVAPDDFSKFLGKQ